MHVYIGEKMVELEPVVGVKMTKFFGFLHVLLSFISMLSQFSNPNIANMLQTDHQDPTLMFLMAIISTPR